MAAEGNKTPAKKKTKNFFQRAASGIAKWFREMRSELKKVIWPNRKQIVNNTAVALVVMVVSAVALWCADEVASLIVNALISLCN